MRPQVVYWNNLPAPYMIDRFNAVARRGNIDLEVWFNDRTAPDRSWRVREDQWTFRYRYLPKVTVRGRCYHLPLPVIESRPDLLVSLYSEPVFITGWLIARARGMRTAFRVLKTFASWNQRHPVKEAIKRYMFSRVDATESPGDDGREFAIGYGTPPERAFIATHTVDLAHFSRVADEARDRRNELRASLGMLGVTFIYVGRLWGGKGIEYLIDAFNKLQASSAELVSLVLVGDGTAEAALRERVGALNATNVRFLGFRHKEELPEILVAADVFVFPTLGDPYGIAVDEAMACGLPVISTTAAGEIRARVIEGKTGILVQPADVDELLEAMRRMLPATTRSALGHSAAELVAGCTPEQWAIDFENMVWSVLR